MRLSVFAFLHQQQLEPLDDSTAARNNKCANMPYAIALDIGAKETTIALTTRRNRAHPNGTKTLEKYVVR